MDYFNLLTITVTLLYRLADFLIFPLKMCCWPRELRLYLTYFSLNNLWNFFLSRPNVGLQLNSLFEDDLKKNFFILKLGC